MIITKISVQEKNKNRCNVFIDDEYAFSLNNETVFNKRLKTGVQISEKEMEEIKSEDEKKEALEKGLNYVSKNLKTKKQLKTYLESKGFSFPSVKFALEKISEYGYINDVEYAKQYLSTSCNSQGKRLSDYKLMMKGIRKEDIEKARENVADNSVEKASKIAEKRLKNKEITKELLSKTFRYLISRGFSYEEAQSAVSKYSED